MNDQEGNSQVDGTGYVAVKHLAQEFGIDSSVCRKFVLKLGLRPQKRRLAESRGMKALVLTPEEAEIARSVRRQEYCTNGERVAAASPPLVESGSFYVIQLVPELDPRRLKFGFAASVEGRLAEHRTAAPTACVLRTWLCKRTWEGPAIECLSVACRLILGEVYECEDLDLILARADQFFGLLPNPESRPRLAQCSPYNT